MTDPTKEKVCNVCKGEKGWRPSQGYMALKFVWVWCPFCGGTGKVKEKENNV